MDRADNKVLVIPAEEVKSLAGESSERKIRVAAYCRVSTDEDRQIDSFENQIKYFTDLVEANSRYELVNIYSDEGITGCSTKSRKGFLSMISDCEQGKIDFIITKSISRFARNTQDSLSYTRRLKDIGIGIHFEKEGINTLESSGELLLTLFSCFAQEESRSISENTSWGIRSKFKQGIPHINAGVLLGYDKNSEGRLVINEEQAAVVRRIYGMFIEGFSLRSIASTLNREGVNGVYGEPKWCAATIARILKNEKYKGSVLMQKTFTSNYLTRRNVQNRGQLPQYYIENDHEAIIDAELWDAVQQETERRRRLREKYGLRGYGGNGSSAFLSRLFCEACSSRMQRIYNKGTIRPFWRCMDCGTRIDDEELRGSFCEAFNDLAERRASLMPLWRKMMDSGTALEKLRARQIAEITALGTIQFEVPELTQAVLETAWLSPEGDVRFHFLFEAGSRF